MHGSRRARRHRVAWCNGVDKGSEDSGGWRHLIINPRIIIPRAEGSLAGLCRVRCFVYASGWQPPVLHSLVAFCTAVNRLGSATRVSVTAERFKMLSERTTWIC